MTPRVCVREGENVCAVQMLALRSAVGLCSAAVHAIVQYVDGMVVAQSGSMGVKWMTMRGWEWG